MVSEYGSLLSHHGLVEKGSPLDFPNALLGVFAYALFALCPVLHAIPFHPQLYVIASSVAVVCRVYNIVNRVVESTDIDVLTSCAAMSTQFATVYLAYILAFVLKNVCLVCIASYAVNVLLFWNSLQLLYDHHLAAVKKKNMRNASATMKKTIVS